MLKNGFCGMGIGIAAMFLLTMTVSGQEASRTEQKGVTYSINVAGMTCATCSAHAQQALLKVRGVKKAAVDYKAGHAWVTLAPLPPNRSNSRPRNISKELAAAVQQAGYKPTVNYVMNIGRMTCNDCEKPIYESIVQVPGVTAASVNYEGTFAVVTPSPKAKELPKALVAAVRQAGFKAAIHSGP